MSFCKKSSFFENINELFKFFSEMNQNIFLLNLEKSLHLAGKNLNVFNRASPNTFQLFFGKIFFLNLLQTNLRNVFQNNFVSDFEK